MAKVSFLFGLQETHLLMQKLCQTRKELEYISETSAKLVKMQLTGSLLSWSCYSTRVWLLFNNHLT